ncbi:MAG: DUF1189 domain-containing protein [Lactobacillales bacterium]|jgi:hypothetical protein|nr:DUF1189 domain-containing protein [Lactobacillales bacterium]
MKPTNLKLNLTPLFNLGKLGEARNVSLGKWILQLAFLVFVIALPSLFYMSASTKPIVADLNKVGRDLPEFSLTDDYKLSMKDSSATIKTKTFDVYFLPNEKINTDSIDARDAVSDAMVSVTLYKDRMYVNAINPVIAAYLQKPLTLDYMQYSQYLQNNNSKDLKKGLTTFSVPRIVKVFIYIGLLLPTILTVLSDLLLACLICHFIIAFTVPGARWVDKLRFAVTGFYMPMLRGYPNKFYTAKPVAFALTIPAVLVAVLSYFFPMQQMTTYVVVLAGAAIYLFSYRMAQAENHTHTKFNYDDDDVEEVSDDEV